MKISFEASGFLDDASYYFEIYNTVERHIKKSNSITEIKVFLYELPSHIPFPESRKLIDYDADNSSFVINLSGRKYKKGKTSPDDTYSALIRAIQRINQEFPEVFETDSADED